MNEQTDVTLAAAGKVATIVGGGTAVLGGMSANEIAAWVGVIGVVVGLLMQWYFSRRTQQYNDYLKALAAERDAREREEHAARMEGYRNGK